jgi:hypothetical protein
MDVEGWSTVAPKKPVIRSDKRHIKPKPASKGDRRYSRKDVKSKVEIAVAPSKPIHSAATTHKTIAPEKHDASNLMEAGKDGVYDVTMQVASIALAVENDVTAETQNNDEQITQSQAIPLSSAVAKLSAWTTGSKLRFSPSVFLSEPTAGVPDEVSGQTADLALLCKGYNASNGRDDELMSPHNR